MDKTECRNLSGKAYGNWYWSQPGKFNEKPKAERVALILEYRKYRELAKIAPFETNSRGNSILRDEDAWDLLGITRRPQDRYAFDFKYCRSEDGWIQYDTHQDASYFGVWCNPSKLQTVTYAEGDITLCICSTPEGYNSELSEMQDCYGDAPPALIVIGEDGQVTHYYDKRPEALEV